MDLLEIEEKTEQVLDLLTEIADAIQPMIKEDFVRDDPILQAWNLMGGSRVSIRNGLRYFKQAVKDMKGG